MARRLMRAAFLGAVAGAPLMANAPAALESPASYRRLFKMCKSR